MARIEVQLINGLTIVLHGTDAQVMEQFDLMRAMGIGLDDVVATHHFLDLALPSITCPRCGKKSYNRNDVAEKYCGHCKQFHEFLKREW